MFAFGDTVFGEHKCPARATGRSGAQTAAEKYDSLVSKEVGMCEGVVCEEIAKEKWLEATEYYEDLYQRFNNPRDKRIAVKSRNIAEELGWLEG